MGLRARVPVSLDTPVLVQFVKREPQASPLGLIFGSLYAFMTKIISCGQLIRGEKIHLLTQKVPGHSSG